MWQPTASMDAIRARAAMYAVIREFFSQRDVLEVETPLLCNSTAMDPFLSSFALPCDRFLQTSPEFPMKRLLSAGSGPIYQIAKAFRQGEVSGRHNPEFTLLEWYQPGFNLERLQDELLALVSHLRLLFGSSCWQSDTVTHCTYANLFESTLGIDPHTSTLEQLAEVGREKIDVVAEELTRDAWLDLLMSHLIEPHMPPGIVLVTDFPAEQAALAEITLDDKGRKVAKRLEMYIDGMELANGYQELTDAQEQRRRFEEDNIKRQSSGIELLPLPQHLIAALEAGMPPSAGIAVGLDRLLMKLTGKKNLSEVLSFPWERA